MASVQIDWGVCFNRAQETTDKVCETCG